MKFLDANIKIFIYCSIFIKVKNNVLINVWDTTEKNELDPSVLPSKELQDLCSVKKISYKTTGIAHVYLCCQENCVCVTTQKMV